MENIIITGVTGQAGSIFCDYLLKKTDYNLIGVARRCSNPNYVNVEHLFTNPRFKLVTGDITDYASIASIVKDFQPKYFANCAAQSHVHESWKTPLSTFDINVNGVANCLESIRLLQPDCRFITFSSSEMFGDNHSGIININTPLSSKSPYGCSKVAAHHMVKVYRESYGLYAVGGIMFNYEGPRRSKQFVTRKITSNVARIKKSLNNGKNPEPLILGNVNSKRDWSDCEDIVDATWKMLNNEKGARDYIVASGEVHTVKEFVELAFKSVSIHGYWKGEGTKEVFKCLNPKHPVNLVVISEEFYRPNELDYLLGDSTPIRKELKWEPKTSFKQLVDKMVKHDMMLENAKKS